MVHPLHYTHMVRALQEGAHGAGAPRGYDEAHMLGTDALLGSTDALSGVPCLHLGLM